ncbi:hypothetical protein FPZ24_02490 [Sphingomonas panacisoli]|uniref:Glycerophosphoryl diester phosphodiesterase membrane domain-containing protein n=1 Tax=Sphingomonas panacisoli TaxID=1813879 RepID=A0A5B8LEI5_9SPHN|nr:hypothetical protein [Sphingomonas panacisoli]QDZ06481.1 hypothetical protein FPZ24_02490 [Sphingomonas panacisoli]
MVNMGNVWDRTTEFLSENMRALLPVILLAFLIPHTVNTLIKGAAPAVPSALAQGIALICGLIAIWGQLVVIALAFAPDGGRSRAISTATGSLGRAVGAMLILLAATAVLAVPVIATLVANGVDLSTFGSGGMAQANLSGAASVFVSLYSLVLGIVVLVVAVKLALLYPVVVAEGGVAAAIKRAWALSRGIVWKMIGVWLLFVIVYFVALAAITSGIGTVIGLFADMQNPFSVGRIVVAILGGAVTAAFTLIVAAFSAQLYRAVTGRQQGVPAA